MSEARTDCGDPPDPLPADPFVEHYQHRDHLGNLRLVTDEAGNVREAHDYYPFGMELESSYGPSRWLFTGHERDKETGLGYMLARYYGSSLARLLSVDPLADSADPMSPQSWNRYSYVLNNPIVFIDPTGLCTVDPESGPGGDCVTGIVVDNSDATVTVEYGDGKEEEHPAAVGDPSSPEATEEAEGTVTGTAWGPVSNLYVNTQESYSEDPNPDNPFGPAIILVEGTGGRHIHGTTGPINDDTAALGGESPEGRRFTHGCARVCNMTIIDLKALVDRTLAEKVTIKVRFQE